MKDVYTKEELKKIILELMDSNDGNRPINFDENPYACGVHDGLLDVLNALNIETNEEYYN